MFKGGSGFKIYITSLDIQFKKCVRYECQILQEK